MSVRFFFFEPRNHLTELRVLSSYVDRTGLLTRAGAYQLLNSADFPTLQIGKRKLVPKDKLIAWIERRTGGDAFAC